MRLSGPRTLENRRKSKRVAKVGLTSPILSKNSGTTLLSKTGFFLDSSLRPEQLKVEIESCINASKVPFHRRFRAVRLHVSLCCRLGQHASPSKNTKGGRFSEMTFQRPLRPINSGLLVQERFVLDSSAGTITTFCGIAGRRLSTWRLHRATNVARGNPTSFVLDSHGRGPRFCRPLPKQLRG